MIAATQLNRPEVVTQVRATFEEYEAALRSHDIDRINEFFLDSPVTLRLGINEHAYGIDAVRAYRHRAPPLPPGRQLRRTVITTFGDVAASVCTEFTLPDSPMIGRQSQTWVRTETGWKIVSAHVSEVIATELRRD